MPMPMQMSNHTHHNTRIIQHSHVSNGSSTEKQYPSLSHAWWRRRPDQVSTRTRRITLHGGQGAGGQGQGGREGLNVRDGRGDAADQAQAIRVAACIPRDLG